MLFEMFKKFRRCPPGKEKRLQIWDLSKGSTLIIHIVLDCLSPTKKALKRTWIWFKPNIFAEIWCGFILTNYEKLIAGVQVFFDKFWLDSSRPAWYKSITFALDWLALRLQKFEEMEIDPRSNVLPGQINYFWKVDCDEGVPSNLLNPLSFSMKEIIILDAAAHRQPAFHFESFVHIQGWLPIIPRRNRRLL